MCWAVCILDRKSCFLLKMLAGLTGRLQSLMCIRQRVPCLSAFYARVCGTSCVMVRAPLTSCTRMKYYPNSINREEPVYKERHYRAHWQPLWASIGLTLCILLIIFSGWNAVFDLCNRSVHVPTRDSVVDLVFTYLGVSQPANLDFDPANQRLASRFCCPISCLQDDLPNKDQGYSTRLPRPVVRTRHSRGCWVPTKAKGPHSGVYQLD